MATALPRKIKKMVETEVIDGVTLELSPQEARFLTALLAWRLTQKNCIWPIEVPQSILGALTSVDDAG